MAAPIAFQATAIEDESMLKNWELGKIAGVDVRIHWTFWLAMIFYSLTAASSAGLVGAVMTAVTFALVFACVLAHEFGHVLAAARFGIATHDVTLLPIGGLARLARLPNRPIEELIIALAGPAVNVAIALVLLLLTPFQALAALSVNPGLELGGNLLENLLVANVVLVLFNMLPAFPMDGGRVLRSLIAMRTGHLRATEIAARVGRWMALAFIVAGCWWWHIELCLVGLFVLVAGTTELFDARRRAMPNASPLFQYGWVNVDPNNASWQFTGGHPGQSSATSNSDVVDALDVREVKSPPRQLGQS